MKILADTIRAAQVAASDNAGRFALHCVRLRSDGTVEATDGRMLVRVGSGSSDESVKIPALLHPSDMSAILKVEGRTTKRAAGSVIVDVPATNANSKVHVRGGTSAVSAELPRTSGAFPDTDSVIPGKVESCDKGTFSVLLGVELLARMVESARLAGFRSIRLQMTAEEKDTTKTVGTDAPKPVSVTKPVRFDGTNPDTDKAGHAESFVGVLCPVTID